jgi:hypothetical protein
VAITLRELQLTAGQIACEILDGSTLNFTSLTSSPTIPCTSGPVMKDFDLVPGGQSPKTLVQAVQFRTSAIAPYATDVQLKKGLKCTLKLNSGGETYAMQLWNGGLLSGGAVYQFMLVDANYHA